MDIILKSNWFAPGGQRFKKGFHKGVDDAWKDQLPKTAKVVGGDIPAPEPAAVIEEDDPKAVFVAQDQADAKKLADAENEAAEAQNKAADEAKAKRAEALKALAKRKAQK